jgi:hypothetical protein
MVRKNKNTTTPPGGNLPTLRIGSRIRCTDDSVTGRIVWANAVSVKIQWEDGEQVTWKRDSLATRPIEILDRDSDDQPATPAAIDNAAGIAAVTEAEQSTVPSDSVATEPFPAEEQTATTTPEQPQAVTETTPTERTLTAPDPTPTELTATALAVVPEATGEQANPSTDAAPTTAKPKRQRKTPAGPTEKKVSALDAAAKMLAEEGRPMTCKELIVAMAAKGYWTSPGGQTPDATLYSAILRELTTKGEKSRFRKVGRGQFAYHAAQ